MEQKSTKDLLAWQGQNKKGIPELRAAFGSAETYDEKLKIFQKLEARLDENQLGKDCWKMAAYLRDEGQDPIKILEFGKRALTIMLHDQTNAVLGCKASSLFIANILHILGCASFGLKRYNESLGYLNWADRNLGILLLDNFRTNFVLQTLNKIHLQLSIVKKGMGKGDEVVFHLNKVLEIKERTMERGCIEIGRANKNVSDAYVGICNFKEALPFSLKALEIYKEHLADDSEELANLRLSLAGTYLSLGELDKALEQNRLSLDVFRSMGNTLPLLHAEADRGHILFNLGRHEEAIEALKSVISQPENAGNRRPRALAFLGMAKIFCRQGKLAKSKKYIKGAGGILETKGLNPGTVVNGFIEMARLYEDIKEYEAAISMIQKALNIPELTQECLRDCSLRLFSLISLTGTEKKRLPILEEVVARLNEKFGPEHCHVGSAYRKLGDVYVKLGIFKRAAECFVRAKDILSVSLGLHHHASLKASLYLSISYASMERYDLAVENQEKLVECLKGLVPTEQAKVDAAIKLLNILKGRASGEGAESHARASRQVEDGEDMSLRICRELLHMMEM